ncbi:MAG: hypothetical protein IKW03_05395 [Clostridia bacterium]|nr:hypothetical protein [Clostridia bacterium]
MKLLKKTLCVFLSVLMFMTGISTSFVAFAAEADSADDYRALAYSFFNYTSHSSGFETSYVVNTDENGFPVRSLVGDLDQYTISNASDDYKYADEQDMPIRAISYNHRVDAKDNSAGIIRGAAQAYLTIVDKIISTTYGVGLYTVPMVADEVAETLKFTKGDDGNYLFLDGYTYLVNAVGDIKDRSPYPTYKVVDGEIVDLEASDEWLAPYEETMGQYVLMNLYELCHVSTIIDYFSGNCTTINSGNWFHSFVFHCETDLETVLCTEALLNTPFNERELTIEWKLNRQYDDSGTVAQYYNAGYKLDTGTITTNNTRMELINLEGSLNTYFSDYLSVDSNGRMMLDMLRNQDLVNYHYDHIMEHYDTFSSISNKAKIAVFGQSAYSYINLVAQLTPIINPADPDEHRYWPKHTYTKYQDSQGNNIVYEVDAQKVTTIVSTIDGLLKSERVGSILKMFFDYTGPEYEHMAYYYDAQNAKTAQDMLKIVIADFVYQDSIINMLLEMLYPMVCGLLDDLITDEFIIGILEDVWGGLDDIVDGVVNQGEGWQATIYAALASIGITLTPAGLAYVWNRYGYMNDTYGYTTMFPNFRKMHDHLKAAKGGIKKSGLHDTGDYDAIGSERDGYCGDRWRDVDFSQMVWDINGSQEKFLKALDAILAPIAPLLGVLFGDTDSVIEVANVLGTKLKLHLNDEDITHNYYNTILLPLFELLGLPGLLSGEAFEQRADAIRSDGSRNPNTISAFLNDGILSPLLNWVNNILLADPIGTILNLLPNLSYFLTSGAVFSALKTVQVPIKISHPIVLGIPISVYTLDVMDLIGEDTLAFLDSLQGILNLIGFDVDTGIPVIGYYADGESILYRPGMAGYNPDVHNNPATEAYVSSNGDLNLYQDTEFTTLVSGLDENGEYTQYVIRNDIGWANGAGYVVTGHDETHTEAEYSNPVKEFYEYSVVNIVTDENGEEVEESTTYRVVSLDMIPAEIREAGEYGHSQSIVTKEEPASLPPIMDYKLQAVGTVKNVYSGRYGIFSMTGRDGVVQNWADHTRNYIDVQVGGMETEGLVLLFLFRYLFSAVMYRSYDPMAQDFTSDYTLLDAFGLDKEMLTEDLFAGLRIQDILDNVVLNPDGAIAALYELFYKNEFGSIYKVLDGVVVDGDEYSYKPEPVDYHTEEIFGYAEEYDDYNYGTNVLYSEYWTRDKASYMVDNLDDIADNVFAMLKLEDMESLGQFLGDMIGDLLFTNDMLSTIASALYGLLSDLGGSIDIPGILDAALDVDMSKQTLADALVYEFGEAAKKMGVIETETGEIKEIPSIYGKLMAEEAITKQHRLDAQNAHAAKDFEAYHAAKDLELESAKYTDNTFYMVGTDEETGEEKNLYSFDWGYGNAEIKANYSDPEIFLRALSAIASPFAFLFKFLFAGEDLSVLNLITIPGYEGYYYAWIPLMETLGANDGLVDFRTYFSKIFNGESALTQNCDTIYYTVQPLIKFVEKVMANPIETVFNLLPNLLFFISLGGLNDMVNNLIHFAYVLLDILGPVFDAYPLINSLLSNLNIGGMQLNLSVPLDFDFNQLVNQLLEGLLGETLSFDIENKNIVLGTQEVEREVFIPTLDENGEEMFDEEGNVIGTFEMQTFTEDVYAVGTLNIKLPYIDFSTLCAGTVIKKISVSGQNYVYLNTAGGADLLTLIFRIVTDTLFFEDNAVNIANFLIGFCQLDDENDSDDLLMEIFVYLNGEAKKANIPDVIINLIYTIYQVLVPLSGELGSRFKKVDFSITDLFEDIGDMDITGDRISQLLGAGEEKNPTLSGFGRLIELLKQFFEKIAAFFNGLFGG